MKNTSLMTAIAAGLAQGGVIDLGAALGGVGGGHKKPKGSTVIGTAWVGHDKERVYSVRKKMTPKQVKAIRKATGGNRTTHILMRANSQFG